jgi:hypothetical protein
MEAADLWPDLAANLFGVDYASAPQSFAELLELITSRRINERLRGVPTSQEVQLAKIIERGSTGFDQRYTSAMKRYQNKFDRIIVVAGGAHCLSISSKTEYPIEFMLDEEDLPELYYAYLCDYIWPSIVTGGGAAT